MVFKYMAKRTKKGPKKIEKVLAKHKGKIDAVSVAAMIKRKKAK